MRRAADLSSHLSVVLWSQETDVADNVTSFYNLYKTYKNKLTNLLRKVEKEYYQNQINLNKSNLKKSWKIIKEVINKNKKKSIQTEFRIGDRLVTDPAAIVNHFNSFFANMDN